MEATHWCGPHSSWFWVMPLTFMIVMFLFASLIARRAGAWRCGVGGIGPGRSRWWGPDPRGHRGTETPLQILDRRYASGEITREQHEQMKRDAESSPLQPDSKDQ